MEVSRRDFVKMVGAGAAVAGMSGMLPARMAGAAGAASPAAAPLPKEMEVNIRWRQEAGDITDPLAAQTVQIAPNMEPVIPHDDQAAAAQKKLAALEKKTGKKPNILIFLMDNIGWGEPGIYGGGLLTGAPTPNMDRLGREGLQLLSTYSQPSCTPSRATLLTGRLPMRTGALRPSFAGEPGVLDNETTVAKVLSEAGYFTQAVGKWHLGENLESQPQSVGFDDFYGFLGWSGLYTDWQDVEFAPEFALSPDRQALVRSIPFNDHLVHGVKGEEVENLVQITKEVSAELDDMFAIYSEDFIEQMADSDQPFFLYHCTRGAHWKNYPNPKFQGKSPAKYPYKDCVVEMDDVLGRLVKKLEDTDQLENTLIFVTSDNGPAIEPWPDAGYTPFRGGIGGTWEGSMRVPGIVYWKDMITPGQINEGLFDLADLFTTSLALGGVEYRPPEDQYLDGIDQTSFLLADAGLSNRKYVYYWLRDVFSALRVAEYKFMLAGMSDDEPDVINPGSSTVLENYKNGKLYNLYLDPRERFSFFNRQTFMDNLFSDPIAVHTDTFKEYPGKKARIEAKIEEFLHSR
ncbi:MAG TPA: sulfatase-like hydrolase/transferase [Anaerolineae bacterium]|nr:sulfatase-like hydrolase/transferase [Anaerolineae bacterium]